MLSNDRRAFDLAYRQGGVLSRAQVEDLGFSRRQVQYRLSDGTWESVNRLGYRLTPTIEPEELLRAATYLMPAAVVSHCSAALLHEIPGELDHRPTVSVHSRTTHEFPGVVVKRCHDMRASDVDVVRGLPTTTVARTIFDLSSEYTERRLRWVVHRLMESGSLTVEDLADVVAGVGRRGKPGTGAMRLLLRDLDFMDGQSDLESRGRHLLARLAGSAEFISEYPIPWAPHRRFDDAAPAHRLAIEWDSVRYHGQRDAFESDRRRDREAIEHGWRVMRFTWRDVTGQPETVVSSIRAAIQLRFEP